jgi:hypothetical protein
MPMSVIVDVKSIHFFSDWHIAHLFRENIVCCRAVVDITSSMPTLPSIKSKAGGVNVNITKVECPAKMPSNSFRSP